VAKIRVEPSSVAAGQKIRVVLLVARPGHSPYWTFDESQGTGRYMLVASYGGMPASAYERRDEGITRKAVAVSGGVDELVLPTRVPSGKYELCNADHRDWCSIVGVTRDSGP
jgi:hypothetical protein